VINATLPLNRPPLCVWLSAVKDPHEAAGPVAVLCCRINQQLNHIELLRFVDWHIGVFAYWQNPEDALVVVLPI